MKISGFQRSLSYKDCIPLGYGVAWLEYTSNTAVIYPIPFNWIARWIRDAYIFLARGPRLRLDAQVKESNEKAYQRGYDAGYRLGKEQGGVDDLLKSFVDRRQ